MGLQIISIISGDSLSNRFLNAGELMQNNQMIYLSRACFIGCFIMIAFCLFIGTAFQTGKDASLLIAQGDKLFREKEDITTAIVLFERANQLIDVSKEPAQKISLALRLAECYYLTDRVDDLQQIERTAVDAYQFSKHDTLLADIEYIQSLSPFLHGDFARAKECIDKCIRLNTQFHRTERLAYGLYKRGIIYGYVYNFGSSLRDLSSADSLFQSLGDGRLSIRMLGLIGATEADAHNLTDAAIHLSEAVNISKKNGWQEQYAIHINNLATIYSEALNDEQALEYYSEARQAAHTQSLLSLETEALFGMSYSYLYLKEYQHSIEMAMRGIEIAKKLPEYSYLVKLYIHCIELYSELHDFKKAELYFKMAEKILRDAGDQYRLEGLYSSMVNYERKRKNNEGVILFSKRALELSGKYAEQSVQYGVLHYLGEAYTNKHEYDKARNALRIAVQRIENTRSRLYRTLVNSSPLTEASTWTYNLLAAAYIELGVFDSAFMAMDRAKGRISLDHFARAVLQSSSSIPDSIRFRLVRISSEISQLQKKLSGASHAQTSATRQKIDQLEIERIALEKEIERRNPELKQFRQPNSVSIGELRKDVLSKDRIIIEYAVTDDQLNAVALTSDQIIGKRIDIRKDSLLNLVGDLIDMLKQEESEAQIPLFDVYRSHRLYELLIEPFRDVLASKKELVIIPDHSLRSLPFELLVTDASACVNMYDVQHSQFFIESINVSYALSAALLRQDLEIKNTHGSGILAIGNPDFETTTVNREIQQYASVRSSRRKPIRTIQLHALLFAAQEARAIASILSSVSSTVLIGHDATETRFKQLAPDAQIIHIAAHQLIDDDQPLSTKIILARDDDDPSNDGMLNLRELYHMKLHADLAVLSACQTGKGGRNMMGESFTSIAHGFYLAGVPSLVTTMWNIEDKESSELMTLFYKNLRRGQSKSEALSQAKRQMLQSGKRHPYYWAGFILQGNTTPIAIHTSSSSLTVYMFVIAIISIVTFVLIARRKKLFS